MIFFEDSDRIFENENALLKKGGIRVEHDRSDLRKINT
jgi:hypothetical protein